MTNKYLSEGKQTKLTENIINIANTINGDGLNFVGNALLWLDKNLKQLPPEIDKNKIFRKRTADDIISDGYASGCTDYALAFIALCRAKHISTKYIEVVKCSWLESDGTGTIRGHVFAECFIDDNWIQIDPQRATIHIKQNYNGFEIFDEGLDSWDLGITDFDTLKTSFEHFKKKYNSDF
jgi:hypothetical protein